MISSRTPEGQPNQCPVCGKDTRTEPSTMPTRDAPCPHCGSLLWFAPGSLATHEPRAAAAERRADEIAGLLDVNLPDSAYYGACLEMLLGAMQACAGAVWLRTPAGDLRLQFQLNMREVGLERTVQGRERHDELLRRAVATGISGWLSPRSEHEGPGDASRAAGNPTDLDLLLVPVQGDQGIAGVLEVWQDPMRPGEAKRGSWQFLLRMAGHIGSRLQSR